MFKVNNKNSGSGVFIVLFKHISHLLMRPLMATLNKYMLPGFIIDDINELK